MNTLFVRGTNKHPKEMKLQGHVHDTEARTNEGNTVNASSELAKSMTILLHLTLSNT